MADIPRLSKETSIFKPSAIGDGIDGAAQTATSYVTEVSDGIWVTPPDAKPSAQGQATASTSGWHIGEALELFKGGVSIIRQWAESGTAKVRVGDEIGGNTLIESDGVSVRNATTTLAKFTASLIELGKNSVNAVIKLCNGSGYIYYNSAGWLNLSTWHASDSQSMQNGKSDVGVKGTSTDAAAVMSAMGPQTSGVQGWAEVRCEAENGTSKGTITMHSTNVTLHDNDGNDSVTVTMKRMRQLFEFVDDWADGDTGYVDLSTQVDEYSAGSAPVYMKSGRVVQVNGMVKPTSSHAASSSTEITIGSLPNGYHPRQTVRQLCQGSSADKWLLTVETGGTLKCSRYSSGGSWAALTTSAWLPFHVTYLV